MVHEVHREPVEEFAVRGRRALHAEILRRLQEPGAEVRLPHPVHRHARGGRGVASRQPAGKGEAGIDRSGRQRMQRLGNPGGHLVGGLEPVAALEHVGRPLRFVDPITGAGHQGECRCPSRPLPPQRLDFRVGVLELGDRRAPVAEHRGHLGRRTSVGGNLEDLSDIGRDGVGHCLGVGRHAQAEPAKVVVLIVVRIVATVVLHELEQQHRALGELHRLLRDEHGLPSHIASTRPGINAPRGVLLAIDRQGHRTVGALVAAVLLPVLGLEFRLQRPFLVGEIRGRLHKLHGDLVGRVGRVGRLHLELAERR